MPRRVKAPKTIAEYGGLEAYLNATVQRHNGFNYKDFLFRINPKRKHPVPKSVIAEDFGVSSRTIYAWLRVLADESEQSNLASSGPH